MPSFIGWKVTVILGEVLEQTVLLKVIYTWTSIDRLPFSTEDILTFHTVCSTDCYCHRE